MNLSNMMDTLNSYIKKESGNNNMNKSFRKQTFWTSNSSVNIYTQPRHIQDSNHVNNLNKTLYTVNSLDETLHNPNSLNETLQNESKLQHGIKCMYTNARSIMNNLTS